MKVLLVNGSSKNNGNTADALKTVGEQLAKEGIDTELFNVGVLPIRDCIGCGKCSEAGCIFKDDICNAFIEKAREADAFIFGTPVYYAHASGRLLCLMDRAFYAAGDAFRYKPATSLVVARRAGTTSALDDLNKYMTETEMPLISSSYWNAAFGRMPHEVEEDAEGMQTLRNLGRNMAWILKSIEAGRNAGISRPESESGARTHFIRQPAGE